MEFQHHRHIIFNLFATFPYHRSDLSKLVGVAVTYALLAKIVLAYFSANGVVSIIWPPSGLALAALLLGGKKYWLSVFFGAFAGNIMAGSSIDVSGFIAIGNTLEALTGFWLLTYFAKFDATLKYLRDFFWLALVSAISACVSALIGPNILWWFDLLQQQAVAGNILLWWQGDVLGMILVAPLLLVWQKWPYDWFKRARLIETVACFGLTFLFGQIAFFDWFYASIGDIVQDHWMFMFVVWGAIRFGLHGVSLILAMTAIQALLGAANGLGFFAADLTETNLFYFWLFMLMLAVVGMTIALVFEMLHASNEELQLAALVYQNSSEAMSVTDADNNIIAVNPAFTKLTGYTPNEIIGRNPNILSSGYHDHTFYQSMWHDINTKGSWKGEIWDRRKTGEVYAQWLSINTIFNKDGSINRRVALFSDITEKKETEELIWKQANFDLLTQLPNRNLFHQLLEQELKKSHRSGLPMAVLFLDLDYFKGVNDTLGHTIGDDLLKKAAHRLIRCVRETDTVSRFGGDEFTIILSELKDLGNVERIAQNILLEIVKPFHLNEETVHISVSIGITFYPNDGNSGGVLLKNADQAMYAAKSQGRNRFCYFTLTMQQAAQTRMQLTNDLHNALANNQFRLFYQPIMKLSSGNIHKAEALIRWQHPVRGLVSPADFIPLAEETGLIVDVGEWVFHEAAHYVKHLRASHHPEFQISINKSPVQFRSADKKYKPWIEQLQEFKLPGQGIVVEITEGLLMNADDSIITDKLLAYRDAGIQVALDDFGTGYSSLSYLKKFDIDYLKIDKAFIHNLAPESDDMVLCEAIIVMAHRLGIDVIAEGIETQEQCDLLTAINCDYGQGYLFSRPVPAEQFDDLLNNVKIV